MGILNVTSDSFYDGGSYLSDNQILNRACQIIDEGGTIIDIGAYSTRPGATVVSEEIEIKQIARALQLIRKEFSSVIISIDTFRSKVAMVGVENGADMINDISGGAFDKQMFSFVAKSGIAYCLMHAEGSIETFHTPIYSNNELFNSIRIYFIERTAQLKKLGATSIIIDPGFGFGKTLDQNYLLVDKIEEFANLGFPLMVGFSRKSMIFKALQSDAKHALSGTIAINTIALLKGAQIIRVHDVKESRDTIKIVSQFKRINQ